MKEIHGKYNTAKIFTEVLDDTSAEQIKTLLNQEFTKGAKIRIMPDVHAGAGCTIGTTMTITDKVVPNLVGVDIGCGVLVAKIQGEVKSSLEDIDKAIRSFIPAGFSIHEKVKAGFPPLQNLRCFNAVDIDRAKRSLGTLGGGNHFIEIAEDENKAFYLLIHSGSRRLGLEVANHYQKKAIASLKRNNIPDALAYCEGRLFDDYIHDMKIIQEFALQNRIEILRIICEHSPIVYTDYFQTVHNYIDTKAMILRKGAVSAQKGEKLIIPINMRDGSLLCTGKGNPDWNYSAPHGAGRILSRTQAKKAYTLDEFTKQMDGIYTTSVSAGTLDECPMAYKSIDEILKNIGDTVEVIGRLRPIYNFKAGDTPRKGKG
ncbi:MAG: RtcB family protein [Clostridiales bacterium]|nr:RtcB family protein [Clostridiales bacterium]